MTPENAIYSVLSGSADLMTLVGGRISPPKSLEQADLPCLTYSIHRGAAPEYTHDGPMEYREPVFQFDSWAADFDSARAINAQMLAALYAADDPTTQFYVFVENDGTTIYEPTGALKGGVHRCMSLARIWHTP